MEIGMYEEEVEDKEIREIAERILPDTSFGKIYRICEQYGEEEADCREYDVYKLVTPEGDRMLKKADKREVSNYEKYLKQKDFCVPKFYGRWDDGADIWIMLESIEGNDLRDMTDELAKAAAKSIVQIQNAFWNHPDRERFEVYLERISRRLACIKDEPEIGEAYGLFFERQKTCHRTLSNGDFLEFNVIDKNGQVFIIDWGFGGIMPYSLDLARFIAHATEDRATFPFYMNDEQKRLFLNTVYENLVEKLDYEQYLYDIKLAVLNEYVEFIEADEDDDRWYYNHARELAREILAEKEGR